MCGLVACRPGAGQGEPPVAWMGFDLLEAPTTQQRSSAWCADRAELIATAQVGSIRVRRDPELLRSLLAGTGLTL